MKTFKNFLDEQLQDEEFKAEYDSLDLIYQIKRQIIEIRIEQNLTQEEAAKRIGISRSALARLESGDFNPTLRTLQRIATGLNKTLTLAFD